MQIQKFQRKPFTVEGVRVTKANMRQVAEWCSGEIKTSGKGVKYIYVDAHRPMTERQTQAFVGDWVLFHDRAFKIYTQNAFARNFELIEAGSGKDHADFIPEEEDTPLPLTGDDSFSALGETVIQRGLASPSEIRRLQEHFRPGHPDGDPHRA